LTPRGSALYPAHHCLSWQLAADMIDAFSVPRPGDDNSQKPRTPALSFWWFSKPFWAVNRVGIEKNPIPNGHYESDLRHQPFLDGDKQARPGLGRDTRSGWSGLFLVCSPEGLRLGDRWSWETSENSELSQAGARAGSGGDRRRHIAAHGRCSGAMHSTPPLEEKRRHCWERRWSSSQLSSPGRNCPR
jgi:hypothetical protein